MTKRDSEDTAPIAIDEPQAAPRPRRGLWWLLGILMILLAGGASGWLGYREGIAQRVAGQQNQVILEATTQYQYALVDFQAGRLSAARQRLEYVIQLDPAFPGAQEKLTEVMLQQAILLTPTPLPPTPTAVLTPTPDLRPVEELYNQAAGHLRSQEWQAALDAAATLRSTDIAYRTVNVDGIYYIALRNLGVQKILTEGDLEGGIYMLTLTERFGPLDRDAVGYRTWARYYLTGASFWGADWKRVIDYFGQFYSIFPSLRDTSGITATERYRIANLRYGDKLSVEGKFCDAVPYYEMGLSLSPDAAAQAALEAAVQYCANPPDGAEETPEVPTITPTLPTDVTVTPEVTPEPSVQPSEEPTPEVTPNP